MWSYSCCLLFHTEESEVPLWLLFLKKIEITYVSIYRNIIGRLLTVSQISCYERWRFLLAGAHRLLHKAFESTISGHVCTAWTETSWPSPDRSWTCLFGMNTMYDHWRSSKSPPTSAQTKRLLNEVVISARLNACDLQSQ